MVEQRFADILRADSRRSYFRSVSVEIFIRPTAGKLQNDKTQFPFSYLP
jgi:hypothetical protein